MSGCGAGALLKVATALTRTAKIRALTEVNFVIISNYRNWSSDGERFYSCGAQIRNRAGNICAAPRRQLSAVSENMAAPRLSHKGTHALRFQNLPESVHAIRPRGTIRQRLGRIVRD